MYWVTVENSAALGKSGLSASLADARMELAASLGVNAAVL